MERLKKFAFDTGAEMNTKTPIEYKYLKVLRKHLLTINGWPAKETGENNHSKYMIILSYWLLIFFILCWILVLMYVFMSSDEMNFYQLGHVYIILFMTSVNVSRVVITLPGRTKFREVVSTFLNKMHLFYYKDVSEFAAKIHKRIHTICHVFTIYLVSQMYAGIVLFNVIPMWTNYSTGRYKHKVLTNATFEHSIYFYLPDQVYTQMDAYVVLSIMNWFTSYLCATLFCMLDLFLSLVVFHLWGHFQILLHDIESFPLPAEKAIVSYNGVNISVGMYSEEEQQQVSKRLKQCVDYHRLVSDYTKRMSDAFGPMLCMSYMFHQVCGCLLLLECSQMTPEALMRYGPLSIILCQQLIQMSVIFELIGTTSEKLKEAVYSVPWQYMNTSNRKTVIIFLVNVQEPIHVKALGLMNIGVKSMAAIFKTSFSYFTFLRSK